jgi:ubiquinone/menaquinone biosynthesis C-methylase UbiE
MVKEFGFKDITALSVSTGNGIWDYIFFKNFSSIKKIVATDVVEGAVKKSDQTLLRSLGTWEFRKVEPDGILPFDEQMFDLVYHLDVIEHTNNPFLFLSEQHRVLKLGGGIIIGTPNIFRPGNIFKLLLGRLRFPVTLGHRNGIGNYAHTHEYYEQQLKMLLSGIGFYNIKFVHCYFGTPLINIFYSKYPKYNLGKSMCHFLMCMAKK